MSPSAHAPISLWIKIPCTLFVALLIPIYWRDYGPANFLWFSDVALFGTLAALWLKSRLLASMMMLSVGLLELVWNIDFFVRLLTGRHLLGITRYMFEPTSLLLRGLSLFHVFLPALLLWLVWRLGYDPRALLYQTLLGWTILLLTYLLTDPAKNINWVFGPGGAPQQIMPAWLYLLLMLVVFPLCIYWPTHRLLRWLFPSAAALAPPPGRSGTAR